MEKAEEAIFKQLNTMSPPNNKPFSEQLDNFLQKERLWQEWKENNCSNFEKPIAKDIQEALKNWDEYRKAGKNINFEKTVINPLQGEKEKKKIFKGNQKNEEKTNLGEFVSKNMEKTAKIVQENITNLRKIGLFDLNIELFKFLDLSKIEVFSDIL